MSYSSEKEPLNILEKNSFGGLKTFDHLISDFEQQDAHELFIELISELDSDAKKLEKEKEKRLPQGGISKLTENKIPFGISRIQFLSKKKYEKLNGSSFPVSSSSSPNSSSLNGYHFFEDFGNHLRNNNGLTLNAFNKSSFFTNLLNKYKKNPFEGLWARRFKCSRCNTYVKIFFLFFYFLFLCFLFIFYFILFFF